MLKYSFMSSYSNCSMEEALNFLKTTDKPIKFTYGLKFRGPSTYEVPSTREHAIERLIHGLTDVKECEDYVDVNEYSGNDMW